MTASPSSDVSVKSGAALPSSTTRSSSRRAVGVVRVSRVGDRDGERFVSPSEQRERIAAIAERDGLALVETLEELDVSGGAALAKRPGLRRAVEMIEAGQAEVIVAAYFDRLVRSLATQAELVERVEQAGGKILAVDVGEVSSASASRWLSSTMLGAVAEYARRATAERTADAKRRAVARGVPPFPNIPPGYKRRTDGTLEPDTRAPIVAEAFQLRAGGATIMEVRAFLAKNGIRRSFHGTSALLESRIVLGELTFGELVNARAHEPIVDPSVWRRVQKMKAPRGRRPKSERLLARAGVLRCATCGSRMVVGTTRQGRRTYSFYRCPPNGDCTDRVTISADIAEATIADEVKRLLDGHVGTASADSGLAAAEAELDRLEHELDAAVRAFDGLDDVDAVRRRLHEIRDGRDAARERVDDLRGLALPAKRVTAADWDSFSIASRRELVQILVERALVSPASHGPQRIRVELRETLFQ